MKCFSKPRPLFPLGVFACSAILTGFSANTAHSNLLVNPGLEADAVASAPPTTNVTGWTTAVAAFTASSPADPTRSGIGSLLLDAPGGFSVPVAFQTFPASPGQVVDLQGYMRTPAALPANATFGLLKITFSDGVSDLPVGAGDVLIGQPGPVANPGVEGLPFLDSGSTPNTWIFTQARGIAPAGTTEMTLFAIAVDESVAKMYFDDLQGAILDPVVTTNADEDNGSADPGTGAGTSLREAIRYATPGSSITFSNTLAGQTITLTNSQLTIDKDLTIDASALAGGVIIDGNNASRVVEIVDDIVTLDSLTLRNGMLTNFFDDFGAGILNAGELTMNHCTVSGNNAPNTIGGGIDNYQSGMLTLNNSTVSGNSAFAGGGIHNISTLTLNNSTVSGNSAIGGGGGIYAETGTSTLNNSTVSGNSAADGGGIFGGLFGSIVTLNNSTVSGNSATNSGGGVRDGYELYSTNSIIAGNTAASNPNLEVDVSGSFAGSNNLTNGAPLLAPLANYGGPTETMPPLPGSPAINAGAATTLTTDQRGAPRSDGSPDIGAVEYQPAIVTTVLDENDNPEGADLSLREAIAREFVSTVTFSNTLAGQTIILTNGQLTIGKSLGVDASALAGGVIIDANNASRVMRVTSGNTVTLDTLMVTNGNASGILNSGTLTLDNSTVSGNTASGTQAGGGIENDFSGTLTLNNSTVSDNTATGQQASGGIYNYGTLTLDNSTVSGNTASDTAAGGGIWNDFSGTLTLNNSTVSDNTATGQGAIGGIANGGTLTLDNSTVSDNTGPAFASIGGILNGFTLTLNNSTVSGNTGDFVGGIYQLGTLTLNNSTVSGNTGVFYGGIHQVTGTGTLNNCTVSDNVAAIDIGGVSAETGGTISITNSIIAGNTAPSNPNLFGPITGSNNLTNGAPLLAPLANYGGPTETMPPLPGSPAIDAGGPTTLTIDQRGLPRLSGEAVDIGAVEVQLVTANSSPLITDFTSLGDGEFLFGFTNDTGVSFRVLACTNITQPLSNWTFIGFATEAPPGSGQFGFADPDATNFTERYYGVKSP